MGSSNECLGTDLLSDFWKVNTLYLSWDALTTASWDQFGNRVSLGEVDEIFNINCMIKENCINVLYCRCILG
jgi:hypothetical protein